MKLLYIFEDKVENRSMRWIARFIKALDRVKDSLEDFTINEKHSFSLFIPHGINLKVLNIGDPGKIEEIIVRYQDSDGKEITPDTIAIDET